MLVAVRRPFTTFNIEAHSIFSGAICTTPAIDIHHGIIGMVLAVCRRLAVGSKVDLSLPAGVV